MRWFLLVTVAGCGSSWQIREDAVLEVGCVDRAWYVDADGDGWGDGATTPVIGCEAPAALERAAANGRDCDDDAASVTGRTGAACPDGLLAAPGPITFRALVHDASEYVAVHGEASPPARFTMAASACAGWSGADPEEGGWAPRGGLVTFGSQAERAALQSAVEEAVGDAAWAGFVGIRWAGDLVGGNWTWEDGSNDALIDAIGWCGDRPLRPEDFFPGLDPSDPERAAGIEAELPHLRPALVLREGGWCLGLPVDAGPPYTRSEAHFVCERPAPDPAAYEERVAPSDGG